MSHQDRAPDVYAHLRVLTMKEVSAMTTYTPQHLYRLIRSGAFPKPIRMGLNRIGFRLSEVEKWFENRQIIAPSPDNQ